MVFGRPNLGPLLLLATIPHPTDFHKKIDVYQLEIPGRSLGHRRVSRRGFRVGRRGVREGWRGLRVGRQGGVCTTVSSYRFLKSSRYDWSLGGRRGSCLRIVTATPPAKTASNEYRNNGYATNRAHDSDHNWGSRVRRSGRRWKHCWSGCRRRNGQQNCRKVSIRVRCFWCGPNTTCPSPKNDRTICADCNIVVVFARRATGLNDGSAKVSRTTRCQLFSVTRHLAHVRTRRRVFNTLLKNINRHADMNFMV